MIGSVPNFINSPYFVPEAGNWHLKPGAPQEVVEEFKEFMRAHEEWSGQSTMENGTGVKEEKTL